jgi:hypothetical protein
VLFVHRPRACGDRGLHNNSRPPLPPSAIHAVHFNGPLLRRYCLRCASRAIHRCSNCGVSLPYCDTCVRLSMNGIVSPISGVGDECWTSTHAFCDVTAGGKDSRGRQRRRPLITASGECREAALPRALCTAAPEAASQDAHAHCISAMRGREKPARASFVGGFRPSCCQADMNTLLWFTVLA